MDNIGIIICLAVYSFIVTIVLISLIILNNYFYRVKDFFSKIEQTERIVLNTYKLANDNYEIAKESNELLYAVNKNSKEKAFDEIECDDTIVEFDGDDTVIAFKRDFETVKDVTCEEYICFGDKEKVING